MAPIAKSKGVPRCSGQIPNLAHSACPPLIIPWLINLKLNLAYLTPALTPPHAGVWWAFWCFMAAMHHPGGRYTLMLVVGVSEIPLHCKVFWVSLKLPHSTASCKLLWLCMWHTLVWTSKVLYKCKVFCYFLCNLILKSICLFQDRLEHLRRQCGPHVTAVAKDSVEGICTKIYHISAEYVRRIRQAHLNLLKDCNITGQCKNNLRWSPLGLAILFIDVTCLCLTHPKERFTQLGNTLSVTSDVFRCIILRHNRVYLTLGMKNQVTRCLWNVFTRYVHLYNFCK